MQVRRYRVLRPWQSVGLRFLLKRSTAGLFLDMRLGKTLTILRRIKLFPKPYKCLIVAPNAAIASWISDCTIEDMGYCLLHGTRKQRTKRLEQAWDDPNCTICLINPEGHRVIPELSHYDWTAVVLDESASYLRNPTSGITKYYTKRFAHVPYRYILTGTPNPEATLEIVPQMLFLGPFLGMDSFWTIRHNCFRTGFTGFGWLPKRGVAERMQKEMADKCLTMSRKDVGVHVGKTVERRVLEFPPHIRKMYVQLEKEFAICNENSETFYTWATQRFVAMRQLCGGFVGEDCVWDGKLKELTSLVTGPLAHESVVVWFSFVGPLLAAFERLKKAKVDVSYLYGKVPVSERIQQIQSFNVGHPRVLLVQEKVGETGMDLSAADTAIYYSEPLSLITRKQTEDRILQIHKDSLLYVHLLVKDSVDEDINTLLKGKRLNSSMFLRRVKMYAEGRM